MSGVCVCEGRREGVFGERWAVSCSRSMRYRVRGRGAYSKMLGHNCEGLVCHGKRFDIIPTE